MDPLWKFFRSSSFALVWALVSATAAAAPLSQADALAQTLERHPQLQALEAERHRLAGENDFARQWLSTNPEISGDWTRRDGTDDTTSDWEVAIAQRVTVPGQRGHRMRAAEARVAALEAEIADLRADLAAGLRNAYYGLAIAAAREETAAEVVFLNDRLVTIARTRFAAGDVSEVDVALAELARSDALRRRLAEERHMATARQAFAGALGVERPPEVTLPPLTPPVPPEPLNTLDAVLAHHPRLAALAARQEASRADLASAQANRFPGITVAAHVGEEASTDRLAGVTLALPLPLFDRQQEAIGAARADATRLTAQAEATRAELRRVTERAHATLTTALAELELFATEILPGLDTHLGRIHRAYELGEIDLTTLTVTQAQVMAARFDHLDALATAWQARIALDRALGTDPVAIVRSTTADATRSTK